MNIFKSKQSFAFHSLLIVATSTVVMGCKPPPPQLPEEGRYAKIDAQGNILDESATEWVCVLDTKTDLMWEQKSTQEGKRNSKATFTNTTNSSKEPVTARGACESPAYNQNSSCHTDGYVSYINDIALCGNNDWRMPSKPELETLLFTGFLPPHFDTNYFPNSSDMPLVWTGTDIPVESTDPIGRAYRANLARLAIYYNDLPRDQAIGVRLVRGAQ